jgi:hypothetical protein
VMECSRSLAANQARDAASVATAPADGRPDEGFVNPYNSCLPHAFSRTCKRIIPVTGAWAPFNPDEFPAYYLIRN